MMDFVLKMIDFSCFQVHAQYQIVANASRTAAIKNVLSRNGTYALAAMLSLNVTDLRMDPPSARLILAIEPDEVAAEEEEEEEAEEAVAEIPLCLGYEALCTPGLVCELDPLEPVECMCEHAYNDTEQGVVIKVGYEPTANAPWGPTSEIYSLSINDELGLVVSSALVPDCANLACAYVPSEVALLYVNTSVDVTWTVLNGSFSTPYGFVQWLSLEDDYNQSSTVPGGYPYPARVCEAAATAASAASRVNMSASFANLGYVSEDGFQYTQNAASEEFTWTPAVPTVTYETVGNTTTAVYERITDRVISSTVSVRAPAAAGVHHLVWYEWSPCSIDLSADAEQETATTKHNCPHVQADFQTPSGEEVAHCLRVRTSLVAQVSEELTVEVSASLSLNFAVDHLELAAVTEQVAICIEN